MVLQTVPIADILSQPHPPTRGELKISSCASNQIKTSQCHQSLGSGLGLGLRVKVKVKVEVEGQGRRLRLELRLRLGLEVVGQGYPCKECRLSSIGGLCKDITARVFHIFTYIHEHSVYCDKANFTNCKCFFSCLQNVLLN